MLSYENWIIDMRTCVYIIIIILLSVRTIFNAKYLILIAYSVRSYLQMYF